MSSPYYAPVKATLDNSSIVSKTYLKMGLAVFVSSLCASIAVKLQYFMPIAVMLVGLLLLCLANAYIVKKLYTISSAGVYALLFGEAAFMGFMLGGSLQFYAPGVISLAFGV